jgi:prepilin-type N-terminal cleavage/methylation domain-containing protein/prepilin-type processing-associated H-X9-DG protein
MARSSVSRRSGFTLIELLVVIAIIGVLIGLLLPAVQKVRDAANRATCQNNLKQIGLAVHNYEDTFGFIPGNTQDEGGWSWSYQQNARSWSWLARLLPYVEQDALYREMNIPNNTFGTDATLLQTGLKVFFCPADTAQGTGTDTLRANLQGVPITLSNYKGVTGSCWAYGTYSYNGGACDGLTHGDGMFDRDSMEAGQMPNSLAKVPDGTSNTFLAGEDLPVYNAHCTWPYANGSLGTCAIPPNQNVPNGGGDIYTGWPDLYSFRSRHSGGLQFVFADGSVHFISQSIALTTYRALATRNGGEIIGDY